MLAIYDYFFTPVAAPAKEVEKAKEVELVSAEKPTTVKVQEAALSRLKNLDNFNLARPVEYTMFGFQIGFNYFLIGYCSFLIATAASGVLLPLTIAGLALGILGFCLTPVIASNDRTIEMIENQMRLCIKDGDRDGFESAYAQACIMRDPNSLYLISEFYGKSKLDLLIGLGTYLRSQDDVSWERSTNIKTPQEIT